MAHVRRAFPRRFARQGEQEVRRRVRQGLAAAADCGIVEEYDLCRYVDLVFLLGDEFGVAGRPRWAAEILRDIGLSPTARLDRIVERVVRDASGRHPDEDGTG